MDRRPIDDGKQHIWQTDVRSKNSLAMDDVLEIDESPSLADILTILRILVDQIFGIRNR